MKKLALTLAFIGVILSSATAQSDDEQKFHFGLKASPVIAWARLDAPDVETDGIRIGFTYGLMTEFAITKNYAFATGVDVSYRGGKFTQKVTGIDGTTVPPQVATADVQRIQKLQMIEIPIGLKLKTNEIGYMKYYGIFGFTPGIIVKATEEVESSNQAIQVDRNKRSNQSDFAVFNVSLNVGLGIEYNLGGSTSFTSGIHYTNGLIDIWSLKDSQMRSDAVTLNLGILF